MIKLSSKTNLNLLLFAFGLFGCNILNVKSQQISDCTIFKEGVTHLGEKYSKVEINDCCNLKDIVTCENNHITGIKIIGVRCDENNVNVDSAISNFGKLEYLTSFEFSRSGWCDDKIPYNLAVLKNLKSLTLVENTYSTSLPENISKITTLENLDLSNNRFNGEIPNCYSDLKNLKTLKLNKNSLSGYIPYTFKQLENLTELDLSDNRDLKGYIPKIPKINSCDYDNTNLCILKSTTCTVGLKNDCTKDDVKTANNLNGNPNPDNKDYESDVKFKFSKLFPDWCIIFVPWIAALSIVLILLACAWCAASCCCCCCSDDDGESLPTTTPTYTKDYPRRREKTNFQKFCEQQQRKRMKQRRGW